MGLLERLLPAERTTDARYGRVTYLARDVWHGRAFRLYGEWSEAEVALWRRLVKPGDVAADVGAHIGAHTLALASLVGPGGAVLAFEPQARVADLLERNLRQNGLALGHVYVYRCALGAARGWASHARPDYRATGNFGGVELAPAGDQSEPVSVIALDELDLRHLDFLKVDVEGAEVDVLNGARDTIKRARPVIYAENDRADRSARLLRVLGFLGYDVMWHLAPLFNDENHRGNPDNVFGATVSMNVLALPRERLTVLRAMAVGDPYLYDINAWRFNERGQLCRTS